MLIARVGFFKASVASCFREPAVCCCIKISLLEIAEQESSCRTCSLQGWVSFRQVLFLALENTCLLLNNIELLEVAEQARLIARVGLFKQVLLLALENHLSAVA